MKRSAISRNDSLRNTGTRVPAFEYRARTRDDTIATSKTIKMPCSTKGVYGSRRQEYVREASPSIRNSDDAIMLTTLPTETIYKFLSRQVTLNYEALYYGGTLEDAKRAESLLQNRPPPPPSLPFPPTFLSPIQQTLLAYANFECRASTTLEINRVAIVNTVHRRHWAQLNCRI